ncbi:polysaccharide pyruvyl transferase family protein [Pedobacter frigiditerrae]|uniref:Polysaccharide pyruvyl transferase family protein n=1 Tax=Pedobacter frigiditerrae TaxID=2530452 RepID=A0A4R0MPG5_9SPHI|nr:polysaccharide pyruvyl transferase family protein [Pedobacter frigiditerrae]TCC88731.1 polysaccharide pyruvyl transferase family protein [Pedobacter frigiditerrae]
MNNRRKFIKNTALCLTGTLLATKVNGMSEFFKTLGLQPHIIVRSGWQTENIGDIAHTPALMALIEKYIPSATVTFWPFYDYLPDNEVEMLKKRFPKMKLVRGKLNKDGKSSTVELQQAISTADLMIHNSGPATIAWADLQIFNKFTGKPFGVYGVTYGLYGTPETNILNKASFVYFRDSVSLEKARVAGVKAPVMDFTPDAVFAIDVTNDERAIAFLKENNLKDGQFLCCIPKQRHTPVWLHPHKNRPIDPVKNQRNEDMKLHDHQPLIEAIIAVIRKTDLKVLITHEDETEMQIGKDWLLDKLPIDVKKKVVWRNTAWLTDEAVSIYKRSAGFFGSEMHSPIMCIAQGIPAIVVRWQEQSSKGIMWRDIGLGEWLFDFDDENEIRRFVPTVLKFAKNLKAAKMKAVVAKKFVDNKQKESFLVVKNTLNK